MRMLLFEWLTGGGLWADQADFDPRCPLLRQGKSMRDRVGEDLVRAGVDLVVMADVRMKSDANAEMERIGVGSTVELETTLRQLALATDFSLFIAPETDGCLERTLQWTAGSENRLVSPDLEFVRWASDKHATCQMLQHEGINVPQGTLLSELEYMPELLDRQMVIKPRFGAGSERVQLVDAESAALNQTNPNLWRVESFIEGISVSVSALCGVEGPELLPPTGQVFDDDPIGHYVGAKYPLTSEIADRATALASRTLAVIPPTRGYIGIDMVISDSGPNEDCVLEINPRLTMSYLKLMQIVGGGLAIKMLEVALGKEHPELVSLNPEHRKSS